MLFSILIPVKNNANTIAESITSCLNQNFEDDYEIIVSNNYSTDNTKNIINSFKDNRIKYFEPQFDLSMYENHNFCLELSQGEYVIFCHADDLLLPNALRTIKKTIQDFDLKENFVLWGKSLFNDFEHKIKYSGNNLNQVIAGIDAFQIFETGGLTPSGTVLPRKSMIELGGYINVNHRFQMSDLVTNFDLILSGFKYIMINDIFFLRYESGLENIVNLVELQNSYDDAIRRLFERFSKIKKDTFLNIILNTKYYNEFVFNTLISDKYITTCSIRKKVIKKILQSIKKVEFIGAAKYLKYLILSFLK